LKLKTLELHGFKSFPEKTVIKFDAGSTVIVGPNGSGKSNITDAMRWVLGELSSKNIRGSKMEDVIFVGADGYRPMGFAEVSVTFDNTDPQLRIDSPYDEITVTRRYYRAGESEYYINRKKVRLRDIYELFMNTGIGREGYSIIGQGRIAEIVSKKSEDRRGFFDESAGIAKYRFKKQESQKKLDETEANMLRVADILSELESRVGPLERQAKKAREYLGLFEQKKEIDIALWLYDMKRVQEDEEKTKADCAISRHELEMAQDTENQLEAQSERLFNASQDNKQEAARLYEKIRETTEKGYTAEKEYHVLENNAVHTEAEMTASEKRMAEMEISLKNAGETLDGHHKKYDEITANIADAEDSLAKKQEEREGILSQCREKESALAEALAAQKKHEETLMEIRVRLNVLKNTLSSQSERSTGLNEDIAKYEKELAEIDTAAADLTESLKEYGDTVEAARKAGDEASKRMDEAGRTAQQLTEKVSALAAEMQALDTRIAALKNMMEQFEGYNNSVRFVMNESKAGRLSGVHGPVSHLIQVDPSYSVALETALGAALQNIVVEDEDVAKRAIYALKNAGAGRATFYPLTSVKANARSRDTEAAAGYPGFVGFADTLVHTDARYADVIGSLLNRIAVFDTLDNATAMARKQGWRVRAVTLDGQQINAGGSFTGGSVRRDNGMLSRSAQIASLTEKRKEIETNHTSASEELQTVQETIASLAAARHAEEDKQNLIGTLMRADQAQMDELNARRSVIENLMEQLREDWAKLSELGKQGDTEQKELEEACSAETAAISEISAARSAIDVERSSLLDTADALSEDISEKLIRIAEIKKDLESAAKDILDTSAAIERLHADIAEAKETGIQQKQSLSDIREAMQTKKAESESLNGELAVLETERAALEAGSMDYEKRLNDLRLRLKDISARKELLATANSKNENKHEQLIAEIDKMTQRLWDEYELTATTAAELGYPPVEDGTRAPMFARLSELKGQIKDLGHVNVAAIDEYAEVKERYDFVSVQMADLNDAKEDLLGIIGSIEDEMKRMFIEAFDKINENFGEVFRELFGGGEAHLSLSDPENVLTSGIEISAAPPGKMIKNLSLLSGGEQSVIAIALLFAMIRVNPSPFCIFDEIEAALDEVNVQRVAQYVKRYSEKMQIIMITHRRGTMEIADTLYGVTMPRHGVSKVFTLDVSSMTDEDFENAL